MYKKTGRAGATRRYKARMSKRPTKTFQKQVLSVVNKIAEKKRWNKIIDTSLGISNNAFITWNLLDGIIQGTNTANRIGDKIFLKNLRLSLDLTNFASSTTNSTVRYRVVIFRGKYDYSSTNYPTGEVFENNAGSVPNYVLSAPIDLNQVTPLFDRTVLITPSYGAQKVHKHLLLNKMLNKAFTFREDDTYGKTSNLYLGIFQVNNEGVAVNIQGNCQVSYTDV